MSPSISSSDGIITARSSEEPAAVPEVLGSSELDVTRGSGFSSKLEVTRGPSHVSNRARVSGVRAEAEAFATWLQVLLGFAAELDALLASLFLRYSQVLLPLRSRQ